MNKPNQDWNPIRGAVPASVIPRKRMSVEPLTPGIDRVFIKPQPASLSHARKWWQRYYNWIFKANVIIDRADGNSVNWASEEDRNRITGEAMFLRAFAYHFPANLWGDVPLQLKKSVAGIDE
jgi:hypothetical protein